MCTTYCRLNRELNGILVLPLMIGVPTIVVAFGESQMRMVNPNKVIQTCHLVNPTQQAGRKAARVTRRQHVKIKLHVLHYCYSQGPISH